MREVWRPVPVHLLTAWRKGTRFCFHYEASSLGRVRRNGVVFASDGKTGDYRQAYVQIEYQGHKMAIGFGAHRFVALAFLRRHRRSMVVNHKNYKKDDNRIENLEWVTRSEDGCHRYARRPGSAKGMRSRHAHRKRVPYMSVYALRLRDLEAQHAGGR